MKRQLPRWLAAPILLGCALAVGLLGAAVALNDRSFAKDEWRTRLDTARALQTHRSAMPRSNAGAAPSLFIVAQSGTLAAASLDTLVRAGVRASGGSVSSSRAEVKHGDPIPADGSALRRIEAQVVFDGRIEAVQSILYRLENEAPLVLIDELSIQQPQILNTPASSPQAPVLHVSATLSAYWASARP